MQANFAASTGFKCVCMSLCVYSYHKTPERECIFSSGTNMKILVGRFGQFLWPHRSRVKQTGASKGSIRSVDVLSEKGASCSADH